MVRAARGMGTVAKRAKARVARGWQWQLGWWATNRAVARAARVMATATKRAIALAVRAMATATKWVEAARGLATATKREIVMVVRMMATAIGQQEG